MGVRSDSLAQLWWWCPTTMAMDLGLSGATVVVAAAAAAAAAAFAPPPPALAFLIALSMSTSFEATSSSLEPSSSPGARIPSSKLPRLEKRGRSSEKRRSQCLFFFKKNEVFLIIFCGGCSVSFSSFYLMSVSVQTACAATSCKCPGLCGGCCCLDDL